MSITTAGVQSAQTAAPPPPPPPPPPLSPVQQGDVAAGRLRVVEGQAYQINDASAPATATWGDQPAGSPYRATFDSVAARLGTSDRAAVTAEIDRQLYGTPTSPAPSPTPAPSAAANDSEGLGSFVEGAIMGDFGDNRSWSALGGQVALGFVPIVGQIADARDTAAAIGQVWRGEEGGWTALGAAAIGWIPGIGDAAKAGIRTANRVGDASVEVAQGVARQGDELATTVPVTRQPDAPATSGAASPTTARQADEAVTAQRGLTREIDPTTGRTRITGEGGEPGAWPRELNARRLEPNADYHINGYRYATDAQGRVSSVEGRLDLDTAARNGYQQRVAGRADRLPDDQGGHLIASIFNGPGDRLNLVPMDGNLNMGAWRSMEARLETALSEGKQVDMKIDVIYSADGARPDQFVIRYVIDGGRPVNVEFDNVAGGGR